MLPGNVFHTSGTKRAWRAFVLLRVLFRALFGDNHEPGGGGWGGASLVESRQYGGRRKRLRLELEEAGRHCFSLNFSMLGLSCVGQRSGTSLLQVAGVPNISNEKGGGGAEFRRSCTPWKMGAPMIPWVSHLSERKTLPRQDRKGGVKMNPLTPNILKSCISLRTNEERIESC